MLKVRTAVYDWDNTLKIMLISSLYYIYTYHVLQGFFNKCTGKSTGILPVHDGNVAGARRRCFFLPVRTGAAPATCASLIVSYN